MISHLLATTSLYYRKRRSFLSSKFKRNILDEMFLVIRIKNRRDIEKGYWEYRISMLRKVSKEIKYACKKVTTPVLIVKGNGFGNFSVSRINVKRSNEYGTICFSCWKLK